MAWHRPTVTALGLGLAVAAWAGSTTAAEPQASLEYPVKAALLVNFAKFTEWPADSAQAQASTVSICVLGIDPFGALLEETVASRSVGGRPITIERHRSVDRVRACHVLFIATSETPRLSHILAQLAGEPVLTVGEHPAFVTRGGVIGVFVADNRARFDVNVGAAERHRLALSSKLLQAAREVVPAETREP